MSLSENTRIWWIVTSEKEHLQKSINVHDKCIYDKSWQSHGQWLYFQVHIKDSACLTLIV